jgi:predicted nucleic-acid-binding Zn-ribbon protein
MKIIDLVANEPLPPLEINEQPGFCPYCGSNNVDEKKGESTCVGYFGYWNLNHRWNSIICRDCGESCTREIKGNNEWYTSNKDRSLPGSVVIKGLPTCFENYTYKCKCGGIIVRKYLNLDNDNDAKVLSSKNDNGVWKKMYRIFFVCDKCGSHEMEDEYWKEHEHKKSDVVFDSNKPIIFKEQIGVGIINPRGVSALSKTLSATDPELERLRKEIRTDNEKEEE